MTEKVLGKIDFAEFGTNKDYPFLIGIQLGFQHGVVNNKITFSTSYYCYNFYQGI